MIALLPRGAAHGARGLKMVDLVSAVTGYAASLATPKGAAIAAASCCGLSLVIAASFARTMVRLRTFTVLSNAFLLLSALIAPNFVSVVLFLILLPLNTWRLVEIRRLTRKVAQAARDDDTSGVWLKPYMKAHRLAAGTFLFNKGDEADALYLLVEGSLELVEIGKQQAPAEIFGEVSFFSPDGRRTLSARCATDCLVLSISGDTFRQLYFQNPKFAFTVANLLGRRLSSDVQRLQSRVAELEAQQAGEPRAA